MSSYNLTDNVNDSFVFSLRGNKFEMRYPKTSELEEIQQITNELQEKEGDKEAEKALNEKLIDSLYSFISPVDHDVQIKEALSNENIKVLQNFNTMIKSELSV